VIQVPDHVDTTLTDVLQAARIRRTIWRKKSVTTAHAWTHESVHILTSLPARIADPVQIASIVRSHWRLETRHWIRDVMFGEDKHTARIGHGPRNLACLRNTAVTRHRAIGTKNTKPHYAPANVIIAESSTSS
jgi:predicted transposase YbfD/YdcC